jgi:NUMOD3 motif
MLPVRKIKEARAKQTNLSTDGLKKFHEEHPEVRQENGRRLGELPRLPVSQETRDKMSKAQERIWTPEKRAEQALISTKAMTPERRDKQKGNTWGKKNLGKKHSPEAKAKMAAKKIGNKNGFGNPEYAAKQAERTRGVPRDPAIMKKSWDTRFIKTVAWG